MSQLVIDKTYQDGEILGEANLDNAFNSLMEWANNGGIGADNIQNNSIGPAEIQTSAVTTAKIADNAVTTSKIADGSVTLAKLAAGLAELIGIPGEVAAYGGNSAPDGWLLCDGTAVSRSTYANLFAVTGVKFGQGDGSTTFNLPDLRGRFLRGVDAGSGRDPDAASRTAMNTGGTTGDGVGSVQLDAFQDHRHSFTKLFNFAIPFGSSAVNPTAANSPGELTDYASTRNGADGTRTSAESRPKNANVQWIIKT